MLYITIQNLEDTEELKAPKWTIFWLLTEGRSFYNKKTFSTKAEAEKRAERQMRNCKASLYMRRAFWCSPDGLHRFKSHEVIGYLVLPVKE